MHCNWSTAIVGEVIECILSTIDTLVRPTWTPNVFKGEQCSGIHSLSDTLFDVDGQLTFPWRQCGFNSWRVSVIKFVQTIYIINKLPKSFKTKLKFCFATDIRKPIFHKKRLGILARFNHHFKQLRVAVLTPTLYIVYLHGYILYQAMTVNLSVRDIYLE